METYKIRTHNGTTVSAVFLLFTMVPVWIFVLWTIRDDVSIGKRLLDLGVADDLLRALPYYYVLYMFFVLIMCYYFLSVFITVIVSDDGISTVWNVKKGFSSKKTKKMVRWHEIQSFDPVTGKWWSGLQITTTDKENLGFGCLAIFVKQKNYKKFIRDFEAHFEVYKNSQTN